ncbi:MAG TPA: hypothetical protein VFP59_14070 [Candidatus Angelobacter sp.]|nr:hypothetical protein [Candidatus Angelobacter sp.]
MNKVSAAVILSGAPPICFGICQVIGAKSKDPDDMSSAMLLQGVRSMLAQDDKRFATIGRPNCSGADPSRVSSR